MKQQSSNKPAMMASQPSIHPNSFPCPSKLKLASRGARRARSATPSAYPSGSGGLSADPPGVRPYLRGLALRSGPAAPGFPAGPIVSIAEEQEKEGREVKCTGSSPSEDFIEGVPVEVARIVVNMQEHYASCVDELAGKLRGVEKHLRRTRGENREMKRRLDMHLVMLRQAAEFMQRVSEECPSLAGVDMDVPLKPVVERGSVRSADGEVGKRGIMEEKYCTRRRKLDGRLPLKPASLIKSLQLSRGKKDGIHSKRGSNVGILPNQDSNKRDDSNQRGNQEDDDDAIKILDGAPRLRALLRRSLWTAINDPAAHEQLPLVNNDTATDYDASSPSLVSASPSRYEGSSTNAKSSSPTPSSSPSPPPPPKPRYSTPRRTTTPRYASGPPTRRFRFHRMGRTVLDVWQEYKHGTRGNPAIESLEREYGTGWRAGSLREVKYASNYVGVRQKVVNTVEEMCEREGIGAEEACRRLDARVDGRMQMLISAVRKGEDPFEVIPER